MLESSLRRATSPTAWTRADLRGRTKNRAQRRGFN
jgi:hypothetical protein